MTAKPDEPSATLGFLFIGGLLALGYFGYTQLFPSDRSQVRACISGYIEAIRGKYYDDEFRQMLAELDQGDDVVITEKISRPLGPGFLVTIDYTVDGQFNAIMCPER